MNAAEAQQYLKVSRSTFIRMENDGRIPRVRLGPKTKRYRKADLDALIESSVEQEGVRETD